MKRLLIIVAMLALLPIGLKAQVKTYGFTDGGFLLKKGAKTEFAMEVGTKTPLFTDTASGFSSYNKTGYFYVDRGNSNDVQAVSSWLMASKTLGIGYVNSYVALGAGMIYEIKDSGDNPGGAFALEIGADIFKSVTLFIALEHQPIKGEGDESALLFGIDLFP